MPTVKCYYHNECGNMVETSDADYERWKMYNDSPTCDECLKDEEDSEEDQCIMSLTTEDLTKEIETNDER